MECASLTGMLELMWKHSQDSLSYCRLLERTLSDLPRTSFPVIVGRRPSSDGSTDKENHPRRVMVSVSCFVILGEYFYFIICELKALIICPILLDSESWNNMLCIFNKMVMVTVHTDFVGAQYSIYIFSSLCSILLTIEFGVGRLRSEHMKHLFSLFCLLRSHNQDFASENFFPPC